MTDDLAIETAGLRKVFGRKTAVARLDLAVPRGEVFGFLGPNGAGKSTSVKMLLGLVRPSAGRAAILGCATGDLRARAKIGFLPEHFRFHDWLTAEELLSCHGRLYGMDAAALSARVRELLDLVGLSRHRDRRVGDFSKGMTQRVGLAQALLNRPELIFLDEPTSGLDPAGRLLVREIIRSEAKRGTTVFLNSHLLGEVEATCDRVAFIRDGVVVDTHRLSSEASSEHTVLVRAEGVTSAALEALTGPACEVEVLSDGLRLTLGAEAEIARAVEALTSHGAQVFAVTPEKRTLEQLFLDVIGEEDGL